MDQAATTSGPKVNGESSMHDLFALSDEQILEIDPELEVPDGRASRPNSSVVAQHAAPLQLRNASDTNHDATQPGNASQNASHQSRITSHQSPDTSHESRATSHDTPQPPPWLAAQMKDPWSGEEAQVFWNGVQQAKTEAAAYRAAIATPEDARALKELYPGGITEARSAAERSRLLDEIDRAYFGAAGTTPEQLGASRAHLAHRMLREDPAAFREMVIAGLRALEEAGQGSGATASPDLPRLAKLFAEDAINVAPPFRAASAATRSAEPASATPSSVAAEHAAPLQGNASRAATSAPSAVHESPVTSHQSLSAYAAFERAANEDLERSVGASIDRTLEQALPVAQPLLPAPRNDGAVRAGSHGEAKSSPLHERLASGVRAEVEKALQGDRQLGEQVAQILASRRFDSDTRAQVVRLINERAQQLVPGAAKRVLSDWTQTTLAAHRTRTQRGDANASRVEVAPASPEPRRASLPARQSEAPTGPRRLEASATGTPRRLDYRKLSDEQILDIN